MAGLILKAPGHDHRIVYNEFLAHLPPAFVNHIPDREAFEPVFLPKFSQIGDRLFREGPSLGGRRLQNSHGDPVFGYGYPFTPGYPFQQSGEVCLGLIGPDGFHEPSLPTIKLV
jgi:hypothetical protein